MFRSLFDHASLPVKLALPVVLLIVTLGVILGDLAIGLRGQAQDGVLINLAGRQRMLNQRHFKEALLTLSGSDANYLATRNLFASTLDILLDGGRIEIGGRDHELPPAPDASLRAKMLENRAQSERFARDLDRYLAEPGGATATGVQLDRLRAANTEIHATANRIVTGFVARSNAKIEAMRNRALVLGALLALLSAVGAGLLIASVVRPIRRTRAVLHAVAKGDLRPRLAIDRADELGTMGRAINQALDGICQALRAKQVDWDRIATERRMTDCRQALAECTPTCIAVTDPDLVVQYLNPAARRQIERLRPKALSAAGDAAVALDALYPRPDGSWREHLSGLPLPQQHEITLDSTILDLSFDRVVDDAGNDLGTMVTVEEVTEAVRNRDTARAALAREREVAERQKRDIGSLLATVEAAAAGDFSVDFAATEDPAVRQITDGLATLFESLSRSFGSLRKQAESLAATSERFSTFSTQVNGNAEATSEESTRVATIATEVNDRTADLASAAEELDATVAQISDAAVDASTAARRAVSLVEQTDLSMKQLADSSNGIGDFIKIIGSIAEQTNLLALNATIEAARAGEAGKGFAVVANEVKELAKESGRATDEISSRIGAIQQDSAQAVAALSDIAESVKRIDEAQSTIADMLREQSTTTRDMSVAVSATADSSQIIVGNIEQVSKRASETLAGSLSVQTSAEDLARMGRELTRLVEHYRFRDPDAGHA